MPDVQPPYVHCQPQTLGVRIGDRVVCTKGDVFIDEGMTGIVVNVAPGNATRETKARVLWSTGHWSTECVSMIDATDIQVIAKEGAA